MKNIKIENVTLLELKEIAGIIAENIDGYRFVFLNGDLGVGKTTFVRFFCENFGINPEDVSSPTFAIVNIYEGIRLIYHVDIYRLTDVNELFYILEDQIENEEGIFLIEWANLFPEYFSDERVEIELKHKEGNKRDLIIRIFGENAEIIDKLRRWNNAKKFESKI
ncbi:tRNA (adenosine(37)-N6)-threonylcarbamoyltransferase complex ATPase subunit type 1 TsaE [Thermosipho atlanticus]|uniref:tRNA threonylcarbamoyladenosine biosynthesis protein TsaE n=1 Tax=Thermosipho atlanticus DSM 15807 TaxID=1123380 RepID=A0A1M5R2F5_9BACT|nr:tRNA (adenosine(37)-N6)-threonylcarbamoyltransferase complex ATPase subunit type 1 TsaE [Thermosipho atlanticus]SHH20159.1 tRNA threonylcarbamoyladenosine biosynthesis protein TsaE [Thermosipho atlanticus DSM 15807]